MVEEATLPYDLGIDVGTTYTCAAVARDGHVEICQLGSSSALLPSIVSIRQDGKAIIGSAAERRMISDPARTVREFKRRLGDDSPYVIGGTAFTASSLMGFMIEGVVEQIVAQEGEQPRRVALTHPADYGRHKLDQLRDAAAGAGIRAPLLIPEPIAAAVAYAARSSTPAGGHLVVYDLGGGTFDAAVVRRDADGPTIVGTAEGLERLGGVDFDDEVFDHVDRALQGRVRSLESGDRDARTAVARLREESRTAKEALSSDTETHISVLIPDAPATIRVTRDDLEIMVRQRVEETLPVLDRVVASAGLRWPDVDAVLTIGGSSRIPLVAQLVGAHSGRPVATDADPKAFVAAGAALLASRTSDVEAIEPIIAPDVAVPPTTTVETAAANSVSSATNRRRGLMIAAGAIVAVALFGSVWAFAGDGEGDTATPSTTTKRRARVSTTSSSIPASSTTGAGGTATGPPATIARATTTTAATAPDPVVVSVGGTAALTCAEATAGGNQTSISWTTTGAASVDVSIDGPGAFETGLSPNGSLAIPAPCGDTQVVAVTAIGSTGIRSDPRSITVTIGAAGP